MHSRLEQYLQTVEQNLQALPAEERDNELSEIRLHIESLAEANKELGSTEEEAVTQTLTQFGRAQTIGKNLTRVHQSGGKPQFHLLVGAVAFNYFSNTLVSMVTSQFFLFRLGPDAASMTLRYMLGLLTTSGIGWLTGVLMPRHAVKGAFFACLLGISISVLLRLMLPTRFIPQVPMQSSWVFLVPACTIATALSMFAAKQGAQWRNTHKTRNQVMRLAR